MHLPTVVFLVPAAVCLLSWAGAGRLLPRRLLSGDMLLDSLTRVGFGSVVVTLSVFGLGRAGLLYRPLLIAATIAGAVAALGLLRRVRRLRRPSPLTLALSVAVVVAILVDLVAATAPVSSADALKYHLALPKLWLQQRSIGDPFWRWEGFNPSGIEMLYTQGLAVGGASTAAALGAILAGLAALAIFGLGRELGGNPLAGVAAAFLFTLQGIVSWEATSSFIELGLTFYVVLAVWHALRWGSAPSRSSTLLTGVFAGAAAGTKYLGLVAAAIVLGIFSVCALLRRRFGDVPVALAGAIGVAGWWYLKNAVATGNPFYPFVFGGKWMSAYASGVIHTSLSSYGVGGGLPRLVLLPVDLLVYGQAFDRGRYVGTAIFVFAVLAVVVRRTAATLVLLGGALVYLVAWHLQSPQARFLLPALAILAAVGGTAAALWLSAAGARRALAAVVLVVAAGAWLVSTAALTRQLLPPTLGIESRTAALERLTGTYDAFRAARRRAGPGTVGLVDYPFAFNFPGRAVSLDVPEFTPALPRRAYLARLRSLGIRDLLVGGSSTTPELDPLRSCLQRKAVFHARFVTSRSLGTSTPLDLVLYSLVGCAG
jgi:Dolichyl-phosphate-mannose-protein mannosyltransferase